MASDPATTTDDLTVIGNYEILHRIATGGMGEVYLAQQRGPVDFKRLVVLKRLHPQLSADPQFIDMFLNEARIAASFTHPNIVHIYELRQEPEGFIIVMEYVRGSTVNAVLRELSVRRGNGLSYGLTVRVATAVCDALDYAHNEPDADGKPRNVIHRDVSPSNVLLGFDGQVKLADFGVAKALVSESVTNASTVKGKFGYMSPEQIRCHPLDQSSDVFSLGTMLWEMSVGRRLFKRENDLGMMYALLEEPIALPSSMVPDYPAALEDIVMKALSRTREDRYPDARSLAADLRAAARDEAWDTDGATLSRLLKELFPNGPPTPGRSGPSSDSGQSQRSPSVRGTMPPSRSEAITTTIRPPAPAEPSSYILPIALLAVLLGVSAAFWVFVLGG